MQVRAWTNVRTPAEVIVQILVVEDVNVGVNPDDAVAGAAEWWTTSPRRVHDADTAQGTLQSLADLGRALHNRIAQIRIRWGFRP